MASYECVSGCRHPLWGGEGNCTFQAQQQQNDDDINLLTYKCSCDAGFFVTTDSLGRPSCVPSRTLTGMYASVGAMAGLAFVFLLWKGSKHGFLPISSQVMRRARLRARLIGAASLYSGSASVVFCIAAARVADTALPLYAGGMLQTLYAISIPAFVLATASIMGIWVDSLPTQIMPVDSFPAKFKDIVEARRVFERVGLVGTAICVAVDPMIFFSDTLKYIKAVNLFTAACAIVEIICLQSVAAYLTSIINCVKLKAPPSSTVFYNRALKTLWIEVLALSLAAAVWIAAVIVLEFTDVGRTTPVFPIAVLVTDANIGFCLAVQFARVSSDRASSSTSNPYQIKRFLSPPITLKSPLGTEQPTSVHQWVEASAEEMDSTEWANSVVEYFADDLESPDDVRDVRTVSSALVYAMNHHMGDSDAGQAKPTTNRVAVKAGATRSDAGMFNPRTSSVLSWGLSREVRRVVPIGENIHCGRNALLPPVEEVDSGDSHGLPSAEEKE